MAVKNKRPLRAYQVGDNGVWIIDEKGRYPKLQCPYKNADCRTDCAFFNIKTWLSNCPVFCGNVQIGILA